MFIRIVTWVWGRELVYDTRKCIIYADLLDLSQLTLWLLQLQELKLLLLLLPHQTHFLNMTLEYTV